MTPIDAMLDSLLPNGAGYLTAERLRWALEQVAASAYVEGRNDALISLRTVADAAEAWGVSRQRANVHIQRLHARYGVGMRVGAGLWLLTREEIAAHLPGPPGRPRKSR